MVLHTSRMNKKGMEMSIQLMVVAAIALIILIVLIVLFTGSAGNFSNTLNSCEDKGYTCRSKCSSDEINFPTGNGECKENGKICCAPKKDILPG